MISVVQDFLADKRIQYAVFILLLAGVLSIGWFGYRRYQQGKEQSAFKEFSETGDAYARITTLADAEGQLKDSERAFLAGAQAHRSSVLYPFFLAFQADTLLRLGKIREAAVQLETAVKAMDQQHPLYYLYALKAALVKIDTLDATFEKQGRDELDKLAKNVANPLQDMALYYSGLDASSHGEHDRALEKFNEIVGHGKLDSYWYQLADQKRKSGV